MPTPSTTRLGVLNNMGLSTTLYLGPYARCPVRPTNKTIKARACANPTCKKSKPKTTFDNVAKGIDFCGACGGPIGMIDVTVESFLSPYDVLTSERLSPVQPEGSLHARQRNPEGVVYFVVNEGNGCPREFHLDSPTHASLRDLIAAGTVGQEVLWFEERYAAELVALKQGYGAVEVLWGVHYYES